MGQASSEARLQEGNEELEAKWQRKARRDIEKKLMLYYQQALEAIEADLSALYAELADEEGLDMIAAGRVLRGDEFQSWRLRIREYAEEIKQVGDTKLVREIESMSLMSRISRLDKLYSETCMELSKLASKFDVQLSEFLGEAYSDCYHRGLFSIGRYLGLYSVPAKVDSEKLAKVLSYPWSGKTYSERIWNNQAKLAEVLQNQLLAGMHRGISNDELSRILASQMNVGLSDAQRLIRTELNYFHNQAALDSVRDAGMRYYRFIATLDKRTSPACREHDGKVYSVDEASPGSNMPPLHPHCRSTIAGSVKGDGKVNGGKRVARQDGKLVKIPANVKYADWLKSLDMAENQFANSGKYGIMISGTNTKQGGAGMNVEQAKKRDHKIYITDVAIQKVPLVRVKGMSLAESEMLQREHMEILRIAKEQNDSNEVLSVFDLSSGAISRVLGTESGASPFNNAVSYSMIINAKRHGLGFLHNHPGTNNFSLSDLATFVRFANIGLMSVVTNQGGVRVIKKLDSYNYRIISAVFTDVVNQYRAGEITHDSAVQKFLKGCKNGGVFYEKGKFGTSH